MTTARMFAVAALTAVLAAACGGSSSPAERGEDPGIAHVHGLGVDPGDGTLYAATHFGVWRMPADGPPVRVADRFQDTMGFTVTGPSEFLGSGHPDFDKDPQLPPRLGLIRSRDAALTWSTVSLSGQVDFHALTSRGASVVGWDSGRGRLMSSRDGGVTWTTGATVPVLSMTLAPSGKPRLLLATPGGLRASTDDGRTTHAASGPPLLALTWPRTSALIGLDREGQAWMSEDQGTTWRRSGSPVGQPEALTATDARHWWVAVAEKGILRTQDAGTTWMPVYPPA